MLNDILYKCPKCGSSEIQTSRDWEDWDDYNMTRLVECNTCSYEWFEVFRFLRNDSMVGDELKLTEDGMLEEEE